jgi:anaerobic magnesium-protoporphyrin IX monomethyl ester cyclase
MKILLINPSDKDYLDNYGDRVPLGLCYVAAALKEAKHDVVIIDLNHSDDKVLELSIASYQPNFIGIGFTTPQYQQANEILRRCRKVSNARVIAGGVHPSLEPLSCSRFDNIIIGEAESIIVDVVESKLTDKYIYASEVDLTTQPFPARYLLDMSKYNMMIDGRRTATLISSRGCPGHCIYCSRLFGEKFRFTPSWNVFSEMMLLWQEYKYDSFYFLDDSFTADEKRLYELASYIKGSGLEKVWQIRVTTRANLITPSIAGFLQMMGVKIVSLGIEHADNDVLKLNAKAMTIEDNEQAIKLLHDVGIKVKGFFILNLPGASKKSIKKTIEFSKTYCDYADYYSLVAFPGTPIWRRPEALGMKILSRDYNFWEAGKAKGHNIENLKVSNEYVDKKIEEARKLW